MKTLRLIGVTILMVVLAVNFAACSDDDKDEVLAPKDNTLELLIGTWEGTGEDADRLLKFNSDFTYSYETPYSELAENGKFEYFPSRYMFVTYYKDSYNGADENTIYTVVSITKDILILNDNGHSDIITFKRK